jgi:hypothetical protein
MIVAAVLDLIYQLIEFQTIHVVALIYAAVLLAFIPYLLIRGPANRIARWNASLHNHRRPLANSEESAPKKLVV